MFSVLPFLIISTIGLFNWEYLEFIDNNIWKYVYKVRFEFLNKIFILITTFGDSWFLFLVVTIFTIFLLLKKDLINAIFLSSSVILGALILNKILKSVYARPRPFESINLENLIEASNYSYPSGHSMGSIIVYFLMCYLISKNIENKNLGKKLYIFFTIFSILIAISRVYLGVHYLTDIVAGFSLGFTWAILSIYFYEKFLITKR
ncbi:phosphatase PAP2 family protein [Gemelliphila palaticanis]|uniref:Phosphatase PAP2 family protein n=1 Tax=Gemelliphila palaticanis TaxID=81950 RepID=A0ABX2SXY3_9BACL|nr:phosphatase PAP2 family protein [Gemella palaticanis]MBF0714736.1 phosphatase PAP2 family protein [Gemella palaticanis]NYS46666.1 phosphatase PAP2 family protein [Gemella palaticanis]